MTTSASHSTLSAPPDFNDSLIDIFKRIAQSTPYGKYLEDCFSVFKETKESFTNPELLKKIRKRFEAIPATQLDQFIHLFHITLFVTELDKSQKQRFNQAPNTTPITEAMSQLLKQSSIEEALNALPFCLTDVLTAHPVDMDRGLIINYKRKLEFMNREWAQKKEAFSLIKHPAHQLSARAELATISQDIRNTIYQLIYTPNYRKNKIKPTSEQRNLSRSIKENEQKIISHWPTLILYVQFSLIEALIKELSETTSLLNLPRCQENLKRFKANKALSSHPLFTRILDLEDKLQYKLEIWRGDMDGNPFITGQTTALSIAYGRKRCFEGLSADDAVIRYAPTSATFQELSHTAQASIQALKKTGQPAWKNYIQEREAEDWDPIQVYSGLIFYRMVELTEAAELFIRSRKNIALLKVGFESESCFLKESKLLEDAEKATGLQGGFWTKCRQLVQLRGLSLGLPHCRKGEHFHLELLNGLIPSLSASTKQVKKEKLNTFLATPFDQGTLNNYSFSEELNTLIETYQAIIYIQPNTTLVQSDSGSVTKDIELSILVLKCISHIFTHTGELVLLCEDKYSMDNAVLLMQKTPPETTLFNRIVMMCAGSDNQKKSGPFYAHYINTLFLETARERGVKTFFGQGDSPLRSSTLTVQTDMKTFQPGSRKIHFFGENIFAYLSDQMATQIRNNTHTALQSESEKKRNNQLIETVAKTIFTTYRSSLSKREDLQQHILSISEIVTTYFSRPSKKYNSEGYSLDQIRAIDSGRAQLILNTFDPQLSGLTKGITEAEKKLSTEGFNAVAVHHFFNSTALGKAILDTLAYYSVHLDDELAKELDSERELSARDIQHSYKRLSGRALLKQDDANLRAVRLLWQYVSQTENTKEHQAVAMMLFGSNWMI